MIKIKKIAIVTTNSFGYIDCMVAKLQAAPNVELTYINIDTIPFKYKNHGLRIKNFFSKALINKSLKDINRTKFIKTSLASEESFDQILIIRPDKLQKEALDFLRTKTSLMTCYLFDGIENFPKQKSLLSYFDAIFSYDKKDVEKFGFTFITNYIYDDFIEKRDIEHFVFSICSYDKRFYFLKKIVDKLTKIDISYLFIVKKERPMKDKKIQFTKHYIALDVVKELISKSKVLVDIQKKNQTGLSFRVFEALGFDKKLITNNQDIVNYDFFNANNIFVISENNFEIPKPFFESDYVEVPAEILNKYKLKNWISEVFKVECD